MIDESKVFACLFDIARGSRDPSTQNAACIVDPTGERVLVFACNNFPEGVKEQPSRWERPLKYSFVEHAERNVIYEAARLGIATRGCRMYACWAACCDCARAIIQAGIKELVVHESMMAGTPEHWKASIADAMAMLQEAGVGVAYSHVNVPPVEIRFNGQAWTPSIRNA